MDGWVWLAIAFIVLVDEMPAPKISKGEPAKSSSPAPPAQADVEVKPGDLLVPGGNYHARILLTGIEAMFGSAAAVKSKLEGAGFKNVNVTDAGGGAYDATGTWGGGSVAAKFPSQVKSVWKV